MADKDDTNLLLVDSETPGLPFLLFLILATLHIYSNYRAVSCLVFTSLNSTRLNLLLDSFRETSVIESPVTINYREPVMRPGHSGRVRIRIGVSLGELKKDEVSNVQAMVDNEDPYCIIQRGKEYVIIISNLAAHVDIYRAYLQCYLQTDNVDKILGQMTASGWDLETLALNTNGFILQFQV